MSETPQIPGGLACDVCFIRKVKCDRQDPCHNCLSSATECRRTRRKGVPGVIRNNDKLQALLDRISHLESSLQDKGVIVGHLPESSEGVGASGSPAYLLPSQESPNPLPNNKRKRNADTPNEGRKVSTTFSIDNNLKQRNDARAFLQSSRLSRTGDSSADQRKVLDAALSLITRISSASSPSANGRVVPDRYLNVTDEITDAEILHVITGCQSAGFASSNLYFPDFIPAKVIERMGIALLNGSVGKATALQYKTIIHFRAAMIFHTQQIDGDHGIRMNQHLKGMELQSTYAALTALDGIGLLATPSLSLLQALLTGAAIMQILGDALGSWSLTTGASRVLIALRYHEITSSASQTESDEEIHACIVWCYQLDKSLSMLLSRPQSLPKLQIPVASLIHSGPPSPLTDFMKLFVELAHVQELALDLVPILTQDGTTAGERVSSIREHLSRIQNDMNNALFTISLDEGTDVILHWRTLDLMINSFKTTMIRLDPSITHDHSLIVEHLSSARKVLESFKDIQDSIWRTGDPTEISQLHLVWTLTSHALCPLYIIFCEVIRTGSPGDFELMREIHHRVSRLVGVNRYIARLRDLCATFIFFCAPIVGRGPVPLQPESSVPNSTTVRDQTQAIGNGTSGAATQMESSTTPTLGVGIDSTDDTPPPPLSEWDEKMVRLFEMRPSVEWYDSDIIDAASGFSVGTSTT